MDFIECLNNQIYDFKSQSDQSIWFEKIRFHSEMFGELRNQYGSIIEDYKIPFTCNCDFCERVDHAKSINSKLKNRVINLFIDQIRNFGHITFNSDDPKNITKFSTTKLKEFGFSDYSFTQEGRSGFSLEFNLSDQETEVLMYASTNHHFKIFFEWHMAANNDGRLLSSSRSLLSRCIICVEFIDLDNFSDYTLEKLQVIYGLIN